MKKILLVTCLATVPFLNVLRAQDDMMDRREKMGFGLKAGINYSNIYDVQGEQFTADPIVGFAGGVFVPIPLGKYLGIEPEVLFSQKGFKANGAVDGNTYSLTRTSDFIDIPLQLEIKPIPYLSILVGPEYSFQIHQKDVFSSSNITTIQETDIQNQNIRKNILGAVAGLDFNVSHFVLSGRVGYDLQNNNGNGTSTNIRYAHSWIQLTVGIKL